MAGQATVVDGDTLRIDGRSVRLHGVDAFEKRQMCGSIDCGIEAKRYLEALVADSIVACAPEGTDRYGRTIALCKVGETDVGAALVRAGWALAYVKYSVDYSAAEAAASSAGAGAWAAPGGFQPPWAWRAARRAGFTP